MDLKTQAHYDKRTMRYLKNSLFCHSGLDPESVEWLKMLDSGACPGLRSAIRRNDKRDNFPALFKVT